MISRPLTSPRMVGRRKQLDFLIERGRAAAQASGSLVFVHGDAGAGKTRLVGEACRALSDLGMRCASAACLEYARSPLAPFIAGLRALIADHSVEVTAGERRVLAKLMLEFGDAVAPSDEAEDKLRQFEALAALFVRAARERPAILVIEDLHWADAATLDFLQHLTRSIGTTSVMLVCTYRNEELTRGHPLRSVVSKLEREPVVWSMALSPLSDDDMRSLIAEVLAGIDGVGPEAINEIRQRAEGNPLLAEELLRTMLDDAQRPGDIRTLPNSVREAVLERLGRLDEFDRSIIVSAAAIGRRFTPAFLAAIAGVDQPRVIPALKRAIDVGLIVDAGAGGAVEFRHALTREAAYGEMLTAEARALHASIATAIEQTPEYPQRIVELANQWWAAGDRKKAAEYCETAGDAAEAVYASQDAASFFERAVQGVDASDPRRGDLSRKLAWSLYRSGFGQRARTAFESAIATFLDAGNVSDAAPTLISLAHLQWTLADIDGHLKATERAVELVGDDKSNPVWFAGRVQMAWSEALGRCNTAAALRLLDEAQSSHADSPLWDRVKFFECKALVRILDGQATEALEDAAHGADVALRAGDVANAVRCWGNVGLLSAQCGEKDVSLQAFSNAIDLIESKRPGGWPVPWAYALFAYAQFLYGDLAAAKQSIERSLLAIHDVPSLDVLVAWSAIPVGLRLEANELVDRCADEELIAYAFGVGSSLVGDVASAFAEYYLAADRRTDAIALLVRGLANLKTHPKPGDYDAMLVMAAQFCEERDARRAQSLLDQSAQATRVRSLPALLALADSYVERRFGDPAKATAIALLAADMFEALHWPGYRARALEAADAQAQAAAVYRQIGDLSGQRRTADLVAPANKRGRRPDELSAREMEIADFVAAGKSNREIAEELVLSERTVESHVSSIFAKLQVKSRREFAERFKASPIAVAKAKSRT